MQSRLQLADIVPNGPSEIFRADHLRPDDNIQHGRLSGRIDRVDVTPEFAVLTVAARGVIHTVRLAADAPVYKLVSGR